VSQRLILQHAFVSIAGCSSIKKIYLWRWLENRLLHKSKN